MGGGSLTKEINLVKILIFAFKYFIIFANIIDCDTITEIVSLRY